MSRPYCQCEVVSVSKDIGRLNPLHNVLPSKLQPSNVLPMTEQKQLMLLSALLQFRLIRISTHNFSSILKKSSTLVHCKRCHSQDGTHRRAFGESQDLEFVHGRPDNRLRYACHLGHKPGQQ